VFSADEMEGIALRYGAFYGQDSFTRMIINLVCKRRLPVASSGGGFANFIYLEDAAAATVAALEKGRAVQAYNLVDGEPVRWADYLDALAAELGCAGRGVCPHGCCERSRTSTRSCPPRCASPTPRPGANWAGLRRCRPTARAFRWWPGPAAERSPSGDTSRLYACWIARRSTAPVVRGGRIDVGLMAEQNWTSKVG
jgi:nucleoside-diphosphate-sugar epimerase